MTFHNTRLSGIQRDGAPKPEDRGQNKNAKPDRKKSTAATVGSSNYAFTLILREPDPDLCQMVMATLKAHGVEFRRGTSGGGNQVRQPYLRKIVGENAWKDYPNVDHVHFHGFYIGNYPGLEPAKILELCKLLNALPVKKSLNAAA